MRLAGVSASDVDEAASVFGGQRVCGDDDDGAHEPSTTQVTPEVKHIWRTVPVVHSATELAPPVHWVMLVLALQASGCLRLCSLGMTVVPVARQTTIGSLSTSAALGERS